MHDTFDTYVKYLNTAWPELFKALESQSQPELKKDNMMYEPIVNQSETQTEIVWDVPGFKKEEIKVAVVGGKLSISLDGARGKKTIRFKLNDVANVSKISSSLVDGVLTILVPVKDETIINIETK